MDDLSKPLNNENGMVLLVAILIMSALILLGTTAVIESQTDMRIAGNYKTSAMSLYAAEAGVEEARARLKGDFTPTGSMIVDSAPTDPAWATTVSSLQSTITYAVTIVHKTSSGNVLYWGDTNNDGKYEINTTTTPPNGQNIYLVTSTATDANASKTLEVNMMKLPPITTPAALYVEASTSIQGTSTYINGNDSCGSSNKPGIATTLSASTVSSTGHPTVSGTTSSSWSVTGGSTDMDVDAMIDNWKDVADYSYSLTSSATHTGMNWGTPTAGALQSDPSSCSESHVVYYNMHGSDIKLAGGSSGCGILLVDGDLELQGGFNWNGLIIVSGSVTITGGGSKNMTGSVVAGGSAEADLVGGNANIVYCSTAINNQTTNRALRILSWTEKEI